MTPAGIELIAFTKSGFGMREWQLNNQVTSVIVASTLAKMCTQAQIFPNFGTQQNFPNRCIESVSNRFIKMSRTAGNS
jgi:hypothetical protein